MPKKMVRFSRPSRIFRSGLARRRFRSCGVGSSTMSTSPESSAAMRVAADLIGVYVIAVTLPGILPHQLGFFLSTIFTSGCQDSRMKGPVPMALRCAKFSSAFLMSIGSVDLFFSAQALLIIRSSVSWRSKTGLGSIM
ncbi:hypothetical protein D3C71_1581100 [compost metagenome]